MTAAQLPAPVMLFRPHGRSGSILGSLLKPPFLETPTSCGAPLFFHAKVKDGEGNREYLHRELHAQEVQSTQHTGPSLSLMAVDQ